MKKHICEVVPIYVRPQPVTDEKACVGVIVRCPVDGFVAYRLIDNDEASIDRVANFFPRLGRENLLRVLAWSKNDIEFSFGSKERDVVEKRFVNLIRPRENVIQYGTPQIRVCAEPQKDADRIYHALVA